MTSERLKRSRSFVTRSRNGSGPSRRRSAAWTRWYSLRASAKTRRQSERGFARDSAFLGIELDEKRNVANAGVISSETSRNSVRVIRTDEESVIASMVCRVLGLTIKMKHDDDNETRTCWKP